MILVAGGTGKLGTRTVRLLTARQLQVRVFTRNPVRAQHLAGEFVEIVEGDLRDQRAVERATAGARAVISAVQAGFGATDGASPKTVDWEGNCHLLAAAQAQGVEHFVMVSIIDAAPDHPLELWRMKYLAEEELKKSQLAWTIIRATAFLEWCTHHVGDSLMKSGRMRIFGRGENPINFVSADDVARFVERSIIDPAMRGITVKVAGPENLTFNQVAQTIQTVTGRTGAIRHVPMAVMRLMSRLISPINAGLAREIEAGIFLDTQDRTVEVRPTREAYPLIPMTGLTDIVRQELCGASQSRAFTAGSDGCSVL